MRKLFFYGFIIATCTFFAEVLAFNYLTALIDPFGYLAYGLLYIIFLQHTEKLQTPKWWLYYLYGILVGFITEAFIAKVIFFGWNDEAFMILGAIPLEAIYLTFFYHPFNSFILPLLFLKKFAGMPVKINFGKFEKPLLAYGFISPFLTASFNATGESIIFLFVSILVICLWGLLLRKFPPKDIFLGKFSRGVVLVATMTLFTAGFFAFPTFGREEILMPSALATIIALCFTAIICGIAIFETRQQTRVVAVIAGSPQKSVLKFGFLLLIWMIILSLTIIFSLHTYLQIGFGAAYVIGIITGMIVFFTALAQIYLPKNRI